MVKIKDKKDKVKYKSYKGGGGETRMRVNRELVIPWITN